MAVIIGNFFLQLLAITLVLTTTLILFLKYWFTYWSKRGVETVSPILFFGNAINIVLRKESIGVNIKQFYAELKRRGKKFGGYYFLLRPIFVPVDLDLVKKILIDDFNHFTDHIGYVNYERDPLSSNLFHSKGDRWKQLRTRLTPSFTSGKMKMMFGTLLVSGKKLITLFEELVERKNEIYIKDVIEQYTSDVILSCGFGIEDINLEKSKSEFQKYQHNFFGTSLIRSLYLLLMVIMPEFYSIFKIRLFDSDMTEFFINLIENTIKYREENNVVRKDFMHVLLQIKNNILIKDNELGNLKAEANNINESALSINEMAGQCFVLYFAGYEPAATILTFSLFEFAVNSEIQDKLREEIDSMVEDNNGDMSYDSIIEMKYMHKCVSETLRKYAPLPVYTRLCTRTYALPDSNVVIKEGMHVLIPTHAIHYDPEFYHNPDIYDPERFSEEMFKARNPYTYIPFGIGPRMCIGYKFGLLMVKLALTILLKRFKFYLHPDTKPQIKFNATTLLPNSTPPIKLFVEKVILD